MFDFDISADELSVGLETLADQLNCTVAQLVAGYVRNTLAVYNQTPRNMNSSLSVTDFDLGYARSALRHQLAESSGHRIAFS